MPVTDRNSALRYLKEAVDTLPGGFFSKRGRRVEWSWQVSEEVRLTVTKRSYSEAKPKSISYLIDLGSVMPPRDGTTRKDYLTVYVLNPVDDVEANKAAYLRCLDDLIANKASFSSEKEVVGAV